MKMETAKYDENRLLHLLLDMGEMLLASGAEINRVEDTLQRIGRAYGAAKMNVFVITSSIVITMERTDGELLTHTRRVNYTGSTDFTALEQLNALSRNCCINPIPLDQFQRRLQGRGDDGIFIWEVSWQQAVLLCFLAGHLQMELWRHWWLS